jgi:hypothetical protein
MPLPPGIPVPAESVARPALIPEKPVPKATRERKLGSDINQLSQELQKLSLSSVTQEHLQAAMNASTAALTDKLQPMLKTINQVQPSAPAPVSDGYGYGRGGYGGRRRGRGGYSYGQGGRGGLGSVNMDRSYMDSRQETSAQVNAAFQD